ncbi:hypothetical protein M3689_05765 [Alkalihalophilus marmarensis]|uniref:hypothetical protein n=1 Tax=Alkalihalophilus marmarensis TaxID=521377 RepID=UPI00203C3890|nr:hypothetical protein [Alkalihalophilus marmarensis]MCM3488812.1 hypothetical protein [Alkalihalophilus marmarensis]
MKIQIEGNLYLESDSRQFIIKEYSNKQDENGNELFKVKGYFGTLSAAINKLVVMEICKSEASTLKELAADLNWIQKNINELLEVRGVTV